MQAKQSKLVQALVLFVLLSLSNVKAKTIDLTYSFNAATHRWPTNEPFKLTVDANTTTTNTRNESYHYSSNTVQFSEHTGTHLDAPIHFALRPGIWATSDIPADRLIAPVALVNLRDKAAANRDYKATAEDIKNFENSYGEIKPGTVVLFDFGWAQYWTNTTAYFGTDTTDTTKLHFPGLSLEAAKVLADKGIYGIGLDTPSMDYGQSRDFDVHVFLLNKNIYFLENVGDMGELPAGGKGVTLFVGVMKIDGGSGGPVRLLAVVDDEPTNKVSSLGGLSVSFLSVFVLLQFHL